MSEKRYIVVGTILLTMGKNQRWKCKEMYTCTIQKYDTVKVIHSCH